jgi:oligopeptide transport system substrate-binding protein
MSRRTPVALALVLGAALGGAGCGDDSSPYYGTTTRTGKALTTFYVNAGAEPEFIDSGRVSEAIGSLFINHLFEGLSVYDPRDAHPTQGVALSWEKNDDNRLFRFHLRENAVWSDGKPVTAHDFAYAWTRVLRPSLGSRAAPNLYVLANGELFSRGQLKVTRNRIVVRSAPSESGGMVSSLSARAPVRILKTEGDYSQIALHERLPAFDPGHPPPEDTASADIAPAPLGFVLTRELVEDASVVGVRATDDHTLDIETERPAPYFLDLTCYPSLSPMRRDVVEPFEARGKMEEAFRPENLVTNGPYTIEDWKFHYEIVTVKSPTYWRAAELKIDRIVWMMVEDSRSGLNLYKAGDLDYLGDSSSISTDAMPFVATKKDFVRSFYLNTYWYELNIKKPPLDDVRVRRALNLAIDKAQLIDRVTRGGQIPATHYVPEFTGSGYSAAVEADKKAGTDPFSGPDADFNPERARALLREAGYEIVEEQGGYKAKNFPALEVLYNTSEGHRNIAVAIQDFWRRHLGISVGLRNEEWKVMLKNVHDGNFQIARFGWIGDYNHPQTWLDTFLSYSPQNRTGWVDPEYDRMVKEAARTADPVLGIRKFREAEKRAVDAMVKLPLYFYTRSVLVKPWVKGFYPNPRNIHLAQWLWIDPDKTAANRPASEPLEYAPPARLGAPGASAGAGP